MRKLSTSLLAALALALIPTAAHAGATSQYMAPKSPLRYHVMRYTFSITANVTAAVVGVIPPGGATLKCIVVSQAAAGEGGTSWVAIPKIGSTQLTDADGGFTLAATANKATSSNPCPMGVLTLPTGGTRPVITAAQAYQSGGQIVTVDVTLTGSYSTAVTGSITLYYEPRW
jgi:hypothetical protein